MSHTYSWKNTEFSSIDPAVAAAALEKIREKNGKLQPADVVEAARDKKHPLHKALPWDDSVAAQVGREAIAARLIRSIKVTVITPEKKEITVRAFVSLPKGSDAGERSYNPLLATLSTPEGREVILRQALIQLTAWRRRFSELSELSQLFDAIDNFLDKKVS